jgi:hypothetical protein
MLYNNIPDRDCSNHITGIGTENTVSDFADMGKIVFR